MNLIKAAKQYVSNGLSVVATDANKITFSSWKVFQQRLPQPSEIEKLFGDSRCKSIAVVCGKVSGNLEVIDVDCKYDLTGSLFNDLMLAIKEADSALADALMVIETRSGGYHLYYRCDAIGGNAKLAQRPASEDEVKANPNEKVLVLIETRGEGGYVIAPPSEGYKKVSGQAIPHITASQRDMLLEVSRSFNQHIIEPPKMTSVRGGADAYATTPWEDYNQRGVDHMLTLLQKHGWTINERHSTQDKVRMLRPGNTTSVISGDYCHSKNLFMVFTTSSIFEPQKGYKPAAVFTLLECKGDFKDGARKLSELGYGEKAQNFGDKLERELWQKKSDGYSKEQLKEFLKSKHDKSDHEALEIIEHTEKKWGPVIREFWDRDKNGKLFIVRHKLERFLVDVGGFALYFYDKASNIYRLVRIQDGFVEETSTEQIKKFIKNYINGLPDAFDEGTTPDALLEIIYKGSETYFSKSFFEFLDHIELDLMKDEPGVAYFPFRNGVVTVSKEGITLKNYQEIGKVIWKSQIIDFNILIDDDIDLEQIEFFRFIEKISSDDESRWMYALTLIGYLLHKYKDPSYPYSVILAEETENESEGGGTGKGILVKAISYLINTERVDGKNFKLDKNFAFQRVNLDTRLVSIEDVRKNVDFEGFFSIITEGITVEKKNKDELYIPFKDSPKILFTTNYTIASNSKAAQRRQKVFEFAPFFGPNNTPRDFFDHNLFDDWEREEWNRFYNLMFWAVKMYLSAGILEVKNSLKLKRKQIRLNFGEEFLEFWDHYSGNGCCDWKAFKELYNGFMIENDFEKKDYSMKRFKKGIEIGSSLFDFDVKTEKKGEGKTTYLRLVKKNDEKGTENNETGTDDNPFE